MSLRFTALMLRPDSISFLKGDQTDSQDNFIEITFQG